MESFPQLTSSLKQAQSRALSLSTNFARLMRLVLEEEMDIVDKEIAQIKHGSNQALKHNYKEAMAEYDEKMKIATARRIAVKDEIDIRFAAMVSAEWSQFKVPIHPH